MFNYYICLRLLNNCVSNISVLQTATFEERTEDRLSAPRYAWGVADSVRRVSQPWRTDRLLIPRNLITEVTLGISGDKIIQIMLNPKISSLTLKITVLTFCVLLINSCRKLDEDGTPRDIRVTWDDTCIFKVPMAPFSICKFPGQEFYVTIAKGQTFYIDLYSKNTCIKLPRDFEVTVKNDNRIIYKFRSKEHNVKIKID